MVCCNDNRCVILVSRRCLYPMPDLCEKPVCLICLLQVHIVASGVCKFIAFSQSDHQYPWMMLFQVFTCSKKSKLVETGTGFMINGSFLNIIYQLLPG